MEAGLCDRNGNPLKAHWESDKEPDKRACDCGAEYDKVVVRYAPDPDREPMYQFRCSVCGECTRWYYDSDIACCAWNARLLRRAHAKV